jgi:hypothetical protein
MDHKIKSSSRRRTTAVVPRSLLAGVSMGIGVIPLCVSCGSIDGDPAPVGILPASDFDAGSDAPPVGIVPATDFDAGSDAAPVGIVPAMDFDAGSDAAPVGIVPAMDFDAGDNP